MIADFLWISLYLVIPIYLLIKYYHWLKDVRTKIKIYPNIVIYFLLIIYLTVLILYGLSNAYTNLSLFIFKLSWGLTFLFIGLKGIQLKKMMGWMGERKGGAAIIQGIISIVLSLFILLI